MLVISYQNTTFYTKNSSPPVCPVLLGPIMLCMLEDKASYITLFQKMTGRIPCLKVYLQAYCTDGEKPLREALGQEFESASHSCAKFTKNRTFKTNVRSYKFLMPSAKLWSMTYSALKGLCMHQQKRSTGKNSRNSSRSGTG